MPSAAAMGRRAGSAAEWITVRPAEDFEVQDLGLLFDCLVWG